jgi:hypothetical protein
MVCDPLPPPSRTPTPAGSPTSNQKVFLTPMICDPPPPPPQPGSGYVPGTGSESMVATARLPLAEIRTVRIVPAGDPPGSEGPHLAGSGEPGDRQAVGTAFTAASPWPEATYRWSASGGVLLPGGDGVIWQLPGTAGRYLLQVVADWGADGLAVDALVVTVDDGGRPAVGESRGTV